MHLTSKSHKSHAVNLRMISQAYMYVVFTYKLLYNYVHLYYSLKVKQNWPKLSVKNLQFRLMTQNETHFSDDEGKCACIENSQLWGGSNNVTFHSKTQTSQRHNQLAWHLVLVKNWESYFIECKGWPTCTPRCRLQRHFTLPYLNLSDFPKEKIIIIYKLD